MTVTSEVTVTLTILPATSGAGTRSHTLCGVDEIGENDVKNGDGNGRPQLNDFFLNSGLTELEHLDTSLFIFLRPALFPGLAGR